MSAQTGLPNEPGSPPSSGGVRRHHTITAASRTPRAGAGGAISEEEDEYVTEEWVGGAGAVGEKSSGLHRQASLPTKYHRAFQSSASGSASPMNSLSAIAGHDDEEDYLKDINKYSVHDDDDQPVSNNNSPISPMVGGPQMGPSPPTADQVRRHVSLTYGEAGRRNAAKMAALKRSGTLQTPLPPHPPEGVSTDGSLLGGAEEEDDYGYAEEPGAYEEDYYKPQQQQPSPGTIGRQSPWSQGNEWRGGGYGGAAVDDVSRALSSMDIGNQQQNIYTPNYPTSQPSHPPRFNAPGQQGRGNNNDPKLQLTTDFANGRRTPSSQQSGPVTSSGNWQGQGQQIGHERAHTSGGNAWEDKARVLQTRTSNPNMQYGYQHGHGKSPSTGSNVSGHSGQAGPIPNVPPIPHQYLQGQGPGQPRLGLATNVPGQQQQQQQNEGGTGQTPVQGFINTPIDVPSLIATKGYNPANFEMRPINARYFVIKSYTEDDVHKSLKYEIWSSTDPGNKRLDKAFKETASRGPIYLFFSVNASGHFCGMAEMLTPVDYTRSSTVWASDKWKGVFKVRWIFVRDIPNVTLRHIKLNNTQERKPVTNSRDTQELLPDAGQEMLRIFHTHPARTSLLQDFAFYELQAMQKMQGQGQGGNGSPRGSQANSAMQSPQLGNASPNLSHQTPPQQYNQVGAQQQQQHFANPNALGYQMPQMSPMMQLQMQMGMQPGNGGNGQGGGLNTQTQAMHQSVMRNPSPQPGGQSQQGFAGF